MDTVIPLQTMDTKSPLQTTDTNTKYLAFYQIDADNNLRNKFISQATGLGLNTIIKKYRSQLKLVFHKSELDHSNVYLVTISASNDYTMIKLAKEHLFPRGFPILWIDSVSMQYFGFYPKFSNDTKAQISDITTEFDNIYSMEFFKKWSGFLGQLIFFEIAGDKFWTVCSKKSADQTFYVKDASRLFAPFITKSLTDQVFAHNLHICAEIMSLYDQVHGSRVLSESPVITAIGTGQFIDLTQTQSQAAPNPTNTEFVKFFDHAQLVDFCVRHNLPCDSAVIINNQATCTKFMNDLAENRDFMTDTKLISLLKSIESVDNISVRKGTVCHSDILGDCLEGLVITLRYTDSATVIKKYKFPNYTVRTMLLRTEFDTDIIMLSQRSINAAKSFVDHWCVSDSGKRYWYEFALKCLLYKHETQLALHTESDLQTESDQQSVQQSDLQTDQQSDQQSVPQSVPQTDSQPDPQIDPQSVPQSDQQSDPQPTQQVGEHIVVAEIVGSTNPYPDIHDKFDKIISAQSDATIIICVGPIGSGKTSFMNKIVEQSDIFEAIDGDDLGIGPLTLKLGKERNDYSRWKVFDSLLRGKIPVISTGGAVMIPDGKNQTIRKKIKSVVGLSCRIILCVSGEFDSVCQLDNDYNAKKFYSSATTAELVKKTIVRRLSTGEWTQPAGKLDDFLKKMVVASSNNSTFANKLMADADIIYGYPLITEKNYGIQHNFDYQLVMSSVVKNKSIPLSGKFSQIRLLVLINGEKSGHITWQYDQTQNITFSLEDFAKLKAMYDNTISGRFITIYSANKHFYEFVCPDKAIHPDLSTHITINCGSHQAKETKTIVLAMIAGDAVVKIPIKNTFVEYSLENIKSEPCEIRILDVFGI